MPGRLIRFDTSLSELLLNIQIRDEDTTEVLKGRWRLVTGNAPTRVPTSTTELDYTCPEMPITGTPGKLERDPLQIGVAASRFQRGKCYRIDVAVSSTFKSCQRSPELFDITTNEDNEEDVGRASYFVWPLSGDALPDSMSDQQVLLESCPADTYQPPGARPSPLDK